MSCTAGVLSASIVLPALADVPEGRAQIVRAPTDMPEPIGDRPPKTVKVELETKEVSRHVDDGTRYRFWTFNGQVPGPMVRVKVGDTVEVHLRNAEDSRMMHNVDFHGATGPGGGAEATLAGPGESKSFSFKAMKPGLYVYHCAVPPVAQHIANGMYGMILVEPEGGLPEVDHEWYVMQGELYTEESIGHRGKLTQSYERLIGERPSYVVFNGAVGALTKSVKGMKAKRGETARIYFGVGGPNLTSSIHLIGEIMDRTWMLASLPSEPLKNVQTATVPPGGATMMDFTFEVPGTYNLVDHALSRVEKGALGHVVVTGEENPEIFDSEAENTSPDWRTN